MLQTGYTIFTLNYKIVYKYYVSGTWIINTFSLLTIKKSVYTSYNNVNESLYLESIIWIDSILEVDIKKGKLSKQEQKLKLKS